jgi:hypothetical protein
MTRFFPNGSVVIDNLTLMESQGTVTRIRTLASLEELAQAVYDHFAIPPDFTMDVVNDLGQLGDAWS